MIPLDMMWEICCLSPWQISSAGSAGTKGFVTRFGGDEFIIFLYTGEKKTLEDTAKAIYKEIKKQDGFRGTDCKEIGQPVEIDDKKLLSCSIGIISSNQVKKAEDIDEMIKVADDLLYAVKQNQRNV